jgi:hypothetical protein
MRLAGPSTRVELVYSGLAALSGGAFLTGGTILIIGRKRLV